MNQKEKRRSISLKDKLSILKEIENGKRAREICIEYKVAKSTISRLKENKEILEEYASKTYVNMDKIKRMKTIKYSETDNVVFSWFLERRQLNDLVPKEIIKLKALGVSRLNNGPQTFVASDGWLIKFKKRHGIRILSVSGERASCNVELANSFKDKFKKYIAESGFSPEQVYNCDETGLVYKSLPNKTNVSNFEKSLVGRKAMKERVTIMSCVNATDTHKLDLMMIGKTKSPRFKNMNLPLYYKSSKNTWQTYTLFSDWFNKIFIPSVTQHLESKNLPVKALLLVDNAACHGADDNFTGDPNSKVMFFPPNNTPLLQPLGQNIIQSLKQRYRKHLLACIAALGAGGGIVSTIKNKNLKDVNLIVQAWDEISVSVIQNSFKYLFPPGDKIQNKIHSDHFSEEDDIHLIRLYNMIFNDCNLADNEIIDWASGTSEAYHLFDLEENIRLENEICPAKGEKNSEDNNKYTDDVINSFNLVVKWAKENDLPCNEILLLQRMREKAIIKKYM